MDGSGRWWASTVVPCVCCAYVHLVCVCVCVCVGGFQRLGVAFWRAFVPFLVPAPAPASASAASDASASAPVICALAYDNPNRNLLHS